MDNKTLTEILFALQSSKKCEELTAAVLKMAALSNAKKSHNLSTCTKPKNYLKFTKLEIHSMPEHIRVLLIYNENLVTYRYHNGIYHARYRRDGYHIEVASADLSVLKKKFLTAISLQTPKEKEDKRFPFMRDFVNEWINIKKLAVKENTLKSYTDLIGKHIIPVFGDKRINAITRSEIHAYLSDLVANNKNRTAAKLKQLLGAIFDIAVEDYGFKSPMTKVTLPHYETKKGKALTKAEEKTLVDWCTSHQDSTAASALLILLYTGMRVGELKSAKLHDNYIECQTEKIRKGYADEFRKIPISPMLRKVMQFIDFNKAISACHGWIKDKLNEIFNHSHHPHELRYTFITRAKEAGCNLELVMLWDGHKFDQHVKSSAVDRGYTDYSDEYYFKEIEKIDYEL